MTNAELDAIEARAKIDVTEHGGTWSDSATECQCWVCDDQRNLLALVAEVKALKSEISDLRRCSCGLEFCSPYCKVCDNDD